MSLEMIHLDQAGPIDTLALEDAHDALMLALHAYWFAVMDANAPLTMSCAEFTETMERRAKGLVER